MATSLTDKPLYMGMIVDEYDVSAREPKQMTAGGTSEETVMKGRRLPATPVDKMPKDYQPGDYWKCLLADKLGTRPIKVIGVESNLTGFMYRVVTPLGQIGTLTKHTVREHDDGTISVRPHDGSSNSILVTDHRGSWHGYIEHGEWRAI